MADALSGSQREQRLQEAIADYFQAAEAGRPFSREEFLARYSDLAVELAAFLEDNAALDRLIAPPDGAEAIYSVVTVPPAAGTSSVPEPLASNGRSFGDYELLEEIGRGGMGVVYRARQISLNRLVALKMILAGQLASADEVRRFRDEAEKAAQLEHPSILPVYEVGQHGGQPYFSMKLVEGGSLSLRAPELSGSPRQAARLMETVTRAVHFAHQRGILHRDLKPANILLDADAQPYVTDFGLAKRLQTESSLTQLGAIVGTPSYMPPEQASAQKGLTVAADVYSLGAILYELLTGRPPFRAETPLDTVLQVLTDEPVPPSRLRPRTPRDLETICLKCLQKVPARRYATAAELADDLHRYQAGEPILARPVGALERAAKWVRRRPAFAAAAAVVLLVASVAFSLVTWQWLVAVEQKEIAEKQKGRAEEQTRLAEGQQQRAEEQTRLAEGQKQRAEQQTRLAEEQTRRAEEQARIAGEKAEAEAKAKIEKAVAQRSAEEAQEDKRRALANSYLAQAHRAIRDGKPGMALGPLDDCAPRFRFWEWRYLKHLATGGQFTLYGHTAPVWDVAFSPDGQRLVSVSQDGTVKVWEVGTGQEMRTFKGHIQHVTAVAFSPDGQRLALASADRTVRVLDARTGQELLSFKEHKYVVSNLSFSPDGQRLASGGGEKDQPGELKVWDARNGQEVLAFQGHTSTVTSVAFSPDGQRLASASWDRTVKMWEARTGREVRTLSGHTSLVGSVAFSPDGQRLASASWDQAVKVWDVQSGQELFSLQEETPGSGSHIRSLAFSPDGRRLAKASGRVRLWDVGTGKEIPTQKGLDIYGSSVAFSPDGQRLATADGGNGTVTLWDARPRQEFLALRGHGQPVTSVAFAPDSQHLASGSQDGTVRVWDTRTGQEFFLPLRGHANRVTRVAFSPVGRQLASADGNGSVKLWDWGSGQEVVAFKGHTGQVGSLSFSPDGRRLVSNSYRDGRTRSDMIFEVKVWDTRNGQELLFLKPANQVIHVSFSPDGQQLALASVEGILQLCSAGTGAEIRAIRGVSSGPLVFSRDGQRLAVGSKIWDLRSGQEALGVPIIPAFSGGNTVFSPDGERRASGSPGGYVQIWDTRSSQEIIALKGDTGAIATVAFSPDGQRLAASGSDGTVKVWEWRPVPEIPFPKESLGYSARFTFSPNSQRLAAGGSDGTVKVWDVPSGQQVFAVKEHTNSVEGLSFSSDGQYLASGGYDRMVKVWDVRAGQVVRTFSGHADVVWSVAFSPNGQRLASGSGIRGPQPGYVSGEIKVWDLSTGQEVLSLKGHTSAIDSLAFSSDGQRLITHSRNEQQVKTWDLVTRQEVPNPDKLPDMPIRQLDSWTRSPDGRYFARADYRFRVIDTQLSEEERAYRMALAQLDVGWHAQEAAEAEKAGQWFAASFHLNLLIANRPFDVSLWQTLALLQLTAGDGEGYRQTCRRLFERLDRIPDAASLGLLFGPAPGDALSTAAVTAAARQWAQDRTRAARMCVVHREKIIEPARLLILAETGDLVTRGAALCRAGRYEEAMVLLRQSDLVAAKLFLALAEHGHGRTDEARQALQQAVQRLETVPPGPSKQTNAARMSWGARLEVNLLRREVEALLSGKKP